jgi:serine/threonine protein kinase
MGITELINKILSAKSIKDIVNVADYKNECKEIYKQIHPDVCKEYLAKSAFIKFEELKELFDNGFKFTDDAGIVTIKENIVTFSGNNDLISKSISNYKKVYNSANDNFKKYIPNEFSNSEMDLGDNYFSLKDVVLPEEHGRWILSRLLEFSAYLSQLGYVHSGLTIDSFLVNPVNHGIKVISFYHMKQIGSKLDTISAKYRLMYPSSVFTDKKAEQKIDTELSKRMICFLLGDSSGIGVKLKKSISEPLINFLLKTSNDSIDTFLEYKKLLKDNYESKFYDLKL